MIAGELYRPGDSDLVARRKRAQRLMTDYNATIYGDDGRGAILADLLGRVGSDCAVRAPIYVDYGSNITLGDNVFLNYGCVLLDVCPITIGNRVDIAPYVQILTADHPRDAATRDAGLEFGQPITIHDNVWIGAGAMLMPGVTIGADAIIGAGAVVTRDVAPGTTVGGVPARPLRR
ncbi:sugar O-acetyltransferase [Thalassococcus sp. BH17M4-6]|uniref:sugar O-acetyltransferase n=1 Tax=Thalassococcus sp. BH17M4-6 TaxID=3413148 RepID=UPI003BCEA2F2